MNELFKEWDKAYQQVQNVLEAVKQGNEFWLNHYISSVKELFKTK